jgi:hypothetical protein
MALVFPDALHVLRVALALACNRGGGRRGDSRVGEGDGQFARGEGADYLALGVVDDAPAVVTVFENECEIAPVVNPQPLAARLGALMPAHAAPPRFVPGSAQCACGAILLDALLQRLAARQSLRELTGRLFVE